MLSPFCGGAVSCLWGDLGWGGNLCRLWFCVSGAPDTRHLSSQLGLMPPAPELGLEPFPHCHLLVPLSV